MGSPAGTAGDPRFRLRASVEPFVDRTGTLYFVRPGRPDLVVREPDALDLALVQALAREPRSVAELARELPAGAGALGAKLDALADADLLLVVDPAASAALGAEDSERFARQLLYLSERGDGHALQRRLRASTVLVLGCGGLGSWTAAAIACAGLGHLILVDHDDVELSNLNRQILFPRAAVGRPKVTAAGEWLGAFDPALRVTTHARRVAGAADLAPLLDGVDAVVLAADTPAYEIGRWVNAACVSRRIPFTVAGQLPPLLKIGPTYVPGVGPCFACHELMLREESALYDEYAAFRSRTEFTAATLGPASGVLGALLGLELFHLLIGERPATCDAALILDMRTLSLRREEVRRRADCPACDDLP